MTVLSININDFGGASCFREEYKENFGGIHYLNEWDKIDKSSNINGIFSFIENLPQKPDIIVFQEFDINSAEGINFSKMMTKLGYILKSEKPSRRPSMTVFFIIEGLICEPVNCIHERNMRAYAIRLSSSHLIYGTHVPPKHDVVFWDEMDSFVSKCSGKLILVGDFNTINSLNNERLNALKWKYNLKDLWYEKGNLTPISKAGDYVIISDDLQIEDIEVKRYPIVYSDHPAVIFQIQL